MDADEFVADIAISFYHVLEKKDIESLINAVTRIGGIKSISVPTGTNTTYIETTSEGKDDITSKIEDLRKLDDIQNIEYQVHKRVTRSIVENSIIWAKEELKKSGKLKVEKLPDTDDIKVVIDNGGEITIKGTSLTITDNKGTINVNFGINRSEIAETQKNIVNEINNSPESKEKSKLWYVQITSSLAALIIKILDLAK